MDFIKTKDKAFADEYLSTGDATASYQKVVPYAETSTAVVAGRKLLSKPEVRDYILQNLQSTPATAPVRIVEKWGEMMEATKSIPLGKELVDVPDNPTQLEALKSVTKMYGVLDGEILVDARSVNVTITPTEAKDLEGFALRLEALSRRLMDGSEQSGEVVDVGD